MSPVSYLLQLPPQWKIYPVFNINLLTSYCKTMMHRDNYVHPLPKLVNNEEEYEVKAILDLRRFGMGPKLQYLIKWKGYPEADNQWEDHDNIHLDNLVCWFQKQNPTKEVHLKRTQSAEYPSFPHMSSPSRLALLSSRQMQLLYPPMTTSQQLKLSSLLQSQPGYPQTAPTPSGLNWTQAL